jgi:SAM-dependent methyltransferase
MSSSYDRPLVVGNVYDKYRTANPLARALMRGFLDAVTRLYVRAGAASVLEVGCGEGHLAHHLVTQGGRPERFVASDVDLSAVAKDLDPLIEVCRASAYELPFADASFDLVLCCEVLEHLTRPGRALAEVARVARRAVLLSAPREPLWRMLNMARAKYVRHLGNTPGHVQHFTKAGFELLARRSLRIVERLAPPPWTVLLGEPLRNGRSLDGERPRERE